MLNCTLGIAANKPDMSKLTEHQQEQLKKIDTYIAGLRKSIEDNYRYRASQLKSRTDNKIRLLEVADMEESIFLPRTQAEIAQNVLELTNFVPPTRRFRINAKRNNRKANERENYFFYEHEYENDFLYKPAGERSRSARLFATFRSLIAESKNNVYKKYKSGCVTLQKNKIYDLNVVLPKLEQKLKQNLKASETGTARGVISGIVYSQDKTSAVVGGKLVRQGDLLDGVKIARIHPDHIEFERNDKSWTQKTGQPAGSYWSK